MMMIHYISLYDYETVNWKYVEKLGDKLDYID